MVVAKHLAANDDGQREVTRIALAGVTRSEPVALEDFAQRNFAEFEVRGNTARQKLRGAVNLVVATHAGVAPDYFDIAGWWQHQDLWWFAFLALVGMVRVAAERTGRPVMEVCSELSAGPGTDRCRQRASRARSTRALGWWSANP